MIIVCLRGGLGNQMFQYAAGLSLSRRLNSDLYVDNNELSQDEKRGYGLDRLGLNPDIADTTIVKQLKGGRWRGCLDSMIRTSSSRTSTLFKEEGFGFNKKYCTVSGDLYLDGYWQCERYFENIKNELQVLYLGKTSEDNASPLIDVINENVVGIHMRRGDYATDLATNAYHGLCSIQYYDSAISLIREKYGDLRKFVFTDDPGWYEREIAPRRSWELISGQYPMTDAEELRCMARCKHQIIANSTFSWWAAWLNSNPQKLVVAPAPWFDVPDMDESDLIPKEWIRLPKNRHYT